MGREVDQEQEGLGWLAEDCVNGNIPRSGVYIETTRSETRYHCTDTLPG